MAGKGMIAGGRDHLTEAGMGYGAHFKRATRIGATLIGAGGACLDHAVLPGIMKTRATSTIIRLNEEIKAGPKHGPAPSKAAEPMWLEFEI